uniref:Gastrin/cholecystokinin-like peptide n=1 Tax=Pelodiscus sinensis TaxID=13735 RepID=K7F3Z6_PELSI|nr:gastrin/cholecystokinin-like peptide [Pelodiscus sinensis]|eukprot:XP_014424595.1 gastrin/cholecystokinin-like peptide [Pelodiscus sinensis]
MQGALFLCLLLPVLAPACHARPNARPPGSPAVMPQRSSRTPGLVRRDLLGALSQDQKHLMAKFLPHIYAELANPEGYWREDDAVRPLHDRDYPGWMDFGRRSLADSDEAL